MKYKRNEQIGECPCPVKGCALTAAVFKFKQAAGDDQRRRFAGRMYGDCEQHGRFGGDGRSGMNEYFLENATIWGPEGKAAAPAPVDSPLPLQKSPSKVKPAPPVKAPQNMTPAPVQEPVKPREVWNL